MKIYLAGPDVFLPDVLEIGRQKIDNLMMIHALDLYGCPLVTPPQMPADIWHDLTAFEVCVGLAAARPTSEC